MADPLKSTTIGHHFVLGEDEDVASLDIDAREAATIAKRGQWRGEV